MLDLLYKAGSMERFNLLRWTAGEMTADSCGRSPLAELTAAAVPGRTKLDECELAALRAATGEVLRVNGDAGRLEYARFLDTAARGIAVDLKTLELVHRDATVLVTGGTGCIGSALIGELLTLGPARIVSVSRGLETRWPRFDGVEYLQLDVRNGSALAELMSAIRPDVVYHLAAQHDPGLAEREVHRTLSTNVTGTANLVAACRALPGVRLACASTGKALRPFTRDIYSSSKKMMERLLAESALDESMTVSAVRFTHVVDNSIILRRLRKWSAADQPLRLHSLETMFYVQSAREAAQLLMSSVIEGHRGRLTMAAIRDLGWPISLLDLAVGVLASTTTKSALYVCGYEVGYEKAPYPGLYDPLVSGSVSPLFNAIEAFDARPATACPDLDVYRPRTPASGRTPASAQVTGLIEQLSRAAGAGGPATELRSLVEACGWALWDETAMSTPLPVRRRHESVMAGKPFESFSADDRRVKLFLERVGSRDYHQRLPVTVQAAADSHRVAVASTA